MLLMEDSRRLQATSEARAIRPRREKAIPRRKERGVVAEDEPMGTGGEGHPAHRPVGPEDLGGTAVDGQVPARVIHVGDHDQSGRAEHGGQLDALGLVAGSRSRSPTGRARRGRETGRPPWAGRSRPRRHGGGRAPGSPAPARTRRPGRGSSASARGGRPASARGPSGGGRPGARPRRGGRRPRSGGSGSPRSPPSAPFLPRRRDRRRNRGEDRGTSNGESRTRNRATGLSQTRRPGTMK